MTKALLVIQGIANAQGYLYKDISCDVFFTSKYDQIVDIPTDTIFAKKTPWYLKPLGKIGSSLDDVFDYLARTEERIETCRLVRESIRKVQGQGYEVDIICHSLGTLLTLTCGPNNPINPIVVNNVYMMGSPLGFKFLLMRRKVEAHCERYSSNFFAKKIFYLYSERDPVSCAITGRNMEIISNRSVDSHIYHTSTTHSAQEYLGFLKEEDKITFEK